MDPRVKELVGKSVLAKGLFEVLRARVQRSWAYDCDAASPTPNVVTVTFAR